MPLSLPYKKQRAPAGETLLSRDAALACLCQHGKHLTAISAAAAALATSRRLQKLAAVDGVTVYVQQGQQAGAGGQLLHQQPVLYII